MTRLETNLNYISSLPDDPTETTAQLKQEFDKAGNTIKDFINSILEPEITADIASSLASAKDYADSAIGSLSFTASNISYDNTSSGMVATNVQGAINELKSGLNNVTTSSSHKIGYGDLVITQHASGTINNGHGGSVAKVLSVSKAGYYPMGIVGFTSSSTNHYNGTEMGACLRDLYLSERNSGSCKIYGVTHVANNEAWTYSSQFTAFVLWARIV